MATKKRKQSKNRKTVKRQTRHFQLRVGEAYPVDAHVQEILEYKKSRRAEVTTIRDGVRLLWALENNDLSVLFEMFPHLKSQFIAPAGGDGGPLDEIKGMLEMIAAGQKTNGYLMQSAGQGTGKQLNAPQFALPIFEDDLDDAPTVIIKASTNTDSSLNFVSALKSLAQ